MNISEITVFLDKCADQSEHFSDIGNLIRQQMNLAPDDDLLPFQYAFDYVLVNENFEKGNKVTNVFHPIVEFSNGQVYPPSIESLNSAIYTNWELVFVSAKHPIIKSRLGDLLWIIKWGDKPYKFAISALGSYFEIAESNDNWDDLDKIICLIRGLSLSKEIKNSEYVQKFIKQIHEKCLLSINEPEPKPGKVMMLLDSLLLLKPNLQPCDIEQIINRCLEVFSENVWDYENFLIRYATFLGDSEKRTAINEKQIEIWLSQPNNNGIVYMANLEHALELARDYGFSKKADEIRRIIQQIPKDSLNFKELSVSLKIENEKTEKYLQSFIHENDWKISFSRFGTYGPPCGKYEENLQVVEKLALDHPLRFLISNSIYDANNVLLRRGNSVDENKQLALVQNEVMACELFASFAPEILKRICEVDGEPDVQTLTEYFSTSVIPNEIAENLAKSFYWFFKGEYDISAHLIIPRIEAIFRLIAQVLGLAIIREPNGIKAGGVITLGEILTGLSGSMDENWRRYFVTLMCNPIGINLRNRVCHGLINKVDAGEAALLLQVACYLRQIEIKPIQE